MVHEDSSSLEVFQDAPLAENPLIILEACSAPGVLMRARKAWLMGKRFGACAIGGVRDEQVIEEIAKYMMQNHS